MLHRIEMTFTRKELNSKTLILATVTDTVNIHKNYQFRAEPVQTRQRVYDLNQTGISACQRCLEEKQVRSFKRPKPKDLEKTKTVMIYNILFRLLI